MPDYFGGIDLVIPVDPVVKAYLLHRNFFGTPPKISSKTTVGMMLTEMMVSKDKHYNAIKYKPEDIIIVKIINYSRNIRNPFLPPEKALKFNMWMRRRIKEDASIFAQAMLHYSSKEIQHALRQFQIQFNLKEDDLTLEALKKDFYRKGKSAKALIQRSLREKVAKTVPQNMNS